jgi:aspartyl-tRNA(Asn)/glutamyl-tRNA(Gln) amidotransferase subunit A
MNTDLTTLTAAELLEGYGGGAFSPVEVLQAMLDRLAQVQPRLNAFRLVDPDIGMAMARASEARWQAGTPCGRLDGVPVSIKDTNLTKGWSTLWGSLTVAPEQTWEEDQPVVARLRSHGAVFFGKTTTPEFGWKGITDSPLTGITRNPWNPSRTPGGSSGGAVAAVATGIGPLATGGDGGGSIRIPCGFTGVFGLKTTYGLVPNLPGSLGTMAVAGPIGRSVRDCAVMLRVISEPDARDPFALPYRDVDYLDGIENGVAGMRIAVSPSLGFPACEPAIADAFASACRVFEELGAIVEEVDLDLSWSREAMDIIWRAGFAESVLSLPPGQLRLVEPALLDTAISAGALSARSLQHAFEDRIRLTRQMQAFHQRYDLLLTPTLPVAAFEAGQLTPDPVRYPKWYDWTPFTWPFNMTRQPAASCPCGLTPAGLPAGLQIVGPVYGDAAVLRASRAFEIARPFPRWQP